MVKDNTYITIQSFMINDLQLKGNDLLVYAIIFGFSQDDESHFTGSLSFLADWTNSTKQGVLKSLKSLMDKGFIGKVEKMKNNVKFCEYYATPIRGGIQQSLIGYSTKFNGGVKQSSPNIITDNINNNLNRARQRKNVDKSVDYGEKVLIGADFKLDFEDEFFYPYRRAKKTLILSIEQWLIENKYGEKVDKNFICRQIGKFAKKQGCYMDLLGDSEAENE